MLKIWTEYKGENDGMFVMFLEKNGIPIHCAHDANQISHATSEDVLSVLIPQLKSLVRMAYPLTTAKLMIEEEIRELQSRIDKLKIALDKVETE